MLINISIFLYLIPSWVVSIMTRREREILRWIEENPMISQQELADRAGITRSSMGVHISNMIKKGYISGKGYILPAASYVAVAGGVNMDVGGISDQPLIPADSNPGRVRMSLGGVGRNVAHNMALLGLDARMITVLGDDIYAQEIMASCAELGIDLSMSLHVPGAATSTYLYIADPDGDMELALSDMEIYRHLTPSVLASRINWLNSAQVLVLDTNIPADSIVWLCEHVEVPIFADPVSVTKAGKLRDVLGKLNTIKPNRLEAELLSGVSITDERSLNRAADVLLETGLHRVFLSLGADGVLAADHTKRIRLPGRREKIVNTTGSGDAFMAALVWAYLQGTNLTDSTRAGMAAAAIAMAGPETINAEMSVDTLRAKMDSIEQWEEKQ